MAKNKWQARIYINTVKGVENLETSETFPSKKAAVDYCEGLYKAIMTSTEPFVRIDLPKVPGSKRISALVIRPAVVASIDTEIDVVSETGNNKFRVGFVSIEDDDVAPTQNAKANILVPAAISSQ